jgi:hypothetical protein
MTEGEGLSTEQSGISGRGDRLQDLAPVVARAVAIGGVLYSITFVLSLKTTVEAADTLAPLFLLAGGLGLGFVLVALYERLRAGQEGLALWALILGVGASFGALIHGAYDLANAINPPRSATGGLPNAIDPRGLLTFGVSAIALALISYLMTGKSGFPDRLRKLGYLLAALLMLLYLGRLIILDAENPLLLGTAALTGLVVNPLWYLWVGSALRR